MMKEMSNLDVCSENEIKPDSFRERYVKKSIIVKKKYI